jgi:membrane carboxypeptidase/penicillin-binding protein
LRGGKENHATLIDRVRTAAGRTIFRAMRIATSAQRMEEHELIPCVNRSRAYTAYRITQCWKASFSAFPAETSIVENPLPARPTHLNEEKDAWFIGYALDSLSVSCGSDIKAGKVPANWLRL